MDWYKLFEITAPSIITGGVIVVGAYLGYFRKKFATYGDIDAKLKKLDKLETIEKALELVKFDAQMQRLDEILKLEKIKAAGKNGVEFKYQIRKEKLVQLTAFTKKIISINSLVMSSSENFLYATHDFSLECKKDVEHFTYDNYKKHIPLKANNEFFNLYDEIELDFKMYFENLDNKTFKTIFERWLKDISDWYTVEYLHKQEMGKILIENPSSKEAISVFDKTIKNFELDCKESNVFSKTRVQLFNEFAALNQQIENETSNNADYV